MELKNLEQFEPTILKLAKTWNIPPLEWQDIAQELRIHLWQQEEKRTTKIKNYNNWAYISCRNKIKDLAKYYQRKKRDVRKTISLNVLMDKGMDFEG